MSRKYKRDVRRLSKRKTRKKKYARDRHERRYGRYSSLSYRPYSLASFPGNWTSPSPAQRPGAEASVAQKRSQELQEAA